MTLRSLDKFFHTYIFYGYVLFSKRTYLFRDLHAQFSPDSTFYLINDGLRDAAGVEVNDVVILEASFDRRLGIRDAQTSQGVVLQVAVLSQEVVDPTA
jgi:hypothetical protein